MYELGTAVAVLAAVLTLLFLTDYLTGAPWHRSVGGRLFASGLAVLAAVLVLAVTRNIFGDFPGYELVRLLVYLAVAVSITAVWWVSRRVRRRGREPAPPDL